MPREDALSKAKRYLGEARLLVTYVNGNKVIASCRGDGAVHKLTVDGWAWRCSCPARSDQCCHLRALRMVVVRSRP